MKTAIRLLLAIFSAAQAWAWSRHLLGMLFTDNLSAKYVSYLFYGIGVFNFGLQSFVFIVLPVLLAYYFWLYDKSRRIQFSALIGICTAWGIGHYFYNIHYLMGSGYLEIRFFFASLCSGVIAGLILASVFFYLQRLEKPVISEASPGFNKNRRILLAAGTGLGTLSVAGSVIGPMRVLNHALKYMDIDVRKLNEGELVTVVLDNSPVWVLCRTQSMIRQLAEINPNLLDPDSEQSQQPVAAKNHYRSIKPQYFVVYGICTHLGCSPAYLPNGNPGSDYQPELPQFFCPCHAAVFDLAGRVIKDTPAKRNLDIPNYEILENTIRIYYPSLSELWRRRL